MFFNREHHSSSPPPRGLLAVESRACARGKEPCDPRDLYFSFVFFFFFFLFGFLLMIRILWKKKLNGCEDKTKGRKITRGRHSSIVRISENSADFSLTSHLIVFRQKRTARGLLFRDRPIDRSIRFDETPLERGAV